MGRKRKTRTPTPEVFQVGRSHSHLIQNNDGEQSSSEVILAARVNEDSEWVSSTLHRVESVLMSVSVGVPCEGGRSI